MCVVISSTHIRGTVSRYYSSCNSLAIVGTLLFTFFFPLLLLALLLVVSTAFCGAVFAQSRRRYFSSVSSCSTHSLATCSCSSLSLALSTGLMVVGYLNIVVLELAILTSSLKIFRCGSFFWDNFNFNFDFSSSVPDLSTSLLLIPFLSYRISKLFSAALRYIQNIYLFFTVEKSAIFLLTV